MFENNNLEPILGHQTNIEFYGCPSDLIDDVVQIKQILIDVAEHINLSVVNTTIHRFSPIGVSGVVVIKESHIAVHTWPEHGYVAIDFFTCNQSYEIEKAIVYLFDKLEAKAKEVVSLKRGNMSTISKYKRI